MKHPTMWCVMNKKGHLIHGTLSATRREATDALFPFMSDTFQSMYWGDVKASRKAYRRSGFRTVKVKVEPVK